MKYDIYFHDDLDGRASAAIFLKFLESRGDKIAHFVPVNFDLQDQWIKNNFLSTHKLFSGSKNKSIVVDFLYHPEADFWFDHHISTFRKKIWQKKFKKSRFHNWNPKYKSCAHQVLDGLRKNFDFKPPKHLIKLVRWLDIIDAALYKSPKEVIDSKKPAFMLDRFIEYSGGRKKPLLWLIRGLAEKPFEELAKDRRVTKIMKKFEKDKRKAFEFYKKNKKFCGRNIVFIDFSKTTLKRIRFLPYYLYRDILYELIIKKTGDLYSVSFSASPWKKKLNKVHLGSFFKEHYNGGGHYGIGVTTVSSYKKAVWVANDVLKHFCKNGEK